MAGRYKSKSYVKRVDMTPAQRGRYVRWWIEDSGLRAAELREIALGCGPIAS